MNQTATKRCTLCQHTIDAKENLCPFCGASQAPEAWPTRPAPVRTVETRFCAECGRQISATAVACPHCGAATGRRGQMPVRSRIIYQLLALFFGGLGVHNFYARRYTEAAGQLLVTVCIGWLVLPLLAVWIWAVLDIFIVTEDGDGQKMVA